jgi:hypothetical protein
VNFNDSTKPPRPYYLTRNRQLAVKLASPAVIRITGMNKKTAMNMLVTLLVQKDVLEDHEALMTIYRR